MNIPRALSIDTDDHRYSLDAHLIGPWLVINLDGKPCEGVITYDMDEGLIVRTALDEAGKIVLNGDDIALETVRGVVTIGLSEAYSGPARTIGEPTP